jgi:hypothetical protein
MKEYQVTLVHDDKIMDININLQAASGWRIIHVEKVELLVYRIWWERE